VTTPTVVSTVTGQTNSGGPGTANAIPYPAGSAGDLVVTYVGYGASGGTTISSWPGWTALGTQGTYGVTDGFCEAWYRVTDGSEGSTVTVTTSAAVRMTYNVWRFRSFVGVPVAASWAINTGGGSSTTGDPPTLTSGFGAVETLWLAGTCFGSIRTVTGYPSGYSGGEYYESFGPGIGTAYLLNIAASEDPGTFAISAASWVSANTVAIQGSQAALGTAISNTDTSVVVTSAANFPTEAQFHILVDGERMMVTGISGGTFTVVREMAAIAHSVGAPIQPWADAVDFPDAWMVTDPGTLIITPSDGNASPLVLKDVNGNVIFDVRSDGSVHIKTGTSVVADL